MGYFGSNCTVPCYHPTFGMSCKQECKCDPSDHMYGCESDGKTSQRFGGFFLNDPTTN